VTVDSAAANWKRGDAPILDQDIIRDLRPATSDEPNALDIMAGIYNSEINTGLQSDWEGGFRVWLGDNWIGHIVEGWFYPDEFSKIGPWLDYQTRRFFPESDYANSPSPYNQETVTRLALATTPEQRILRQAEASGRRRVV
jgi:hypothetical protein